MSVRNFSQCIHGAITPCPHLCPPTPLNPGSAAVVCLILCFLNCVSERHYVHNVFRDLDPGFVFCESLRNHCERDIHKDPIQVFAVRRAFRGIMYIYMYFCCDCLYYDRNCACVHYERNCACVHYERNCVSLCMGGTCVPVSTVRLDMSMCLLLMSRPWMGPTGFSWGGTLLCLREKEFVFAV